MLYVDFNEVDPRHASIHNDLQNWGRWCINRGGRSMHSMWRWCKPPQHWQAITIRPGIDAMQAQFTEKAVCRLPEKPRAAVRWFYVYAGPPKKAASSLGVSIQGLADLVSTGRQMLINKTIDEPRKFVIMPAFAEQ